jgi:hypothetical protein
MLSYYEENNQYSVTINSTEYFLPCGIHPQFKIDSSGYFISFIKDKKLVRIPVSDKEYSEMQNKYLLQEY